MPTLLTAINCFNPWLLCVIFKLLHKIQISKNLITDVKCFRGKRVDIYYAGHAQPVASPYIYIFYFLFFRFRENQFDIFVVVVLVSFIILLRWSLFRSSTFHPPHTSSTLMKVCHVFAWVCIHCICVWLCVSLGSWWTHKRKWSMKIPHTPSSSCHLLRHWAREQCLTLDLNVSAFLFAKVWLYS